MNDEAEKIDVAFLPYCANLNCTKDADMVMISDGFIGNIQVPLCNRCALQAHSMIDSVFARFARIANKKRLLDARDNYEPHDEDEISNELSIITFGR